MSVRKWLGALIIGLMAIAVPALADITPAVSKDQPAAIRADNMDYNSEAHTLLATGNVEISQAGRLVMADKILYDQDKNLVTADGNVIIVEVDGKVFFSDHMVLKDDMSTGTSDALKGRMAGNGLMAAVTGEKVSEDVTKLNRVTFTQCKLCEDGNPIWKIRSNDMTINEDTQRVTYHDAWLDFFGVPAIYTPYFSHPTPQADQQSGFLIPTYGTISNLGAVARVPYYLNINDHLDATFTPIFTTQQGVVFSGEMRNVLENGYYQFNGSITDADKLDDNGNKIPGENQVRGHIAGFGIFSLENNWEWGFAGERATDDTYLASYQFGNQDRLTSRIYLQQLQDRDYFNIEALSFQDLVTNTNPGAADVETPLVLPTAQWHMESDPGFSGSRFIWDNSTSNIYRSEGTSSTRLSSTGQWHIPYITSGGHLFDFSSQLRGDGYIVNNAVNPNNTADDFTGLTGRAIPQVEADWRYPLVNDFGSGRVYLEPVTNFIASPLGGNSFHIPNEDSQEVDLSDLNIFDPNRFTGYDRVEDGARVNYGFRGGIYGQDRGNINFLFGQNYRANSDYKYPAYSGFENNFSDYVGRLGFSDDKIFNIAYRFRLAENNLTFNRNELDTGINLGKIKLDVNYILAKRDPATEDFISTVTNSTGEEVFGNISYSVNQNWQVNLSSRRDLSEGENSWINNGLSVIFKNECLLVDAILNKNYTTYKEIPPSTSFVVKVSFPGLTGAPPAVQKPDINGINDIKS